MFLPLRNLRVWIRRALNLLLLAGGVGAALAAVFARRAGDWELARGAALVSLACVTLSGVFVLPSLVRAAWRDGGSLFDFPARPTIGGFIYLIVLFFIAYAAWMTGNNLLFLIFSVMLSALLVTWAAGRANLRDLMVGVRFPEHIFAGETAPVVISLHNRKRWLPALSVLVKARHRALPDVKAAKESGAEALQKPLVYFVYLSRRARLERKGEIIFMRRGRISISNFDLITHFPLNLFRLRRRFYARDMNLIVYPKPQPVNEDLQLLPSACGHLTSMRRSAGHDLHSLRRYRPQDDLRHIDWKATARTRQLTVREWMAETERRVRIQLDTRIAGADEVARFERGVTLAASLVKQFINEDAKVRLSIGARDEGDYGSGEAHLYDCLRRLALVAPAPAEGGAEEGGAIRQFAVRETAAETSDYTFLITAAPDAPPSNLLRDAQVIRV